MGEPEPVGPVIALEGGICAGKSTLSHQLSADGPWRRGKEYIELIPAAQHQQIVRLPPADRVATFLKIDSDRIGRQAAGPIVLDRCALTMFAFEFAWSREEKSPLPPGLHIGLLNNDVVYPDAVVYLDISHSTRLSRSKNRGDEDLLEFLRSESFNIGIRSFFELVSSYVTVHFIKNENDDKLASLRFISELNPPSIDVDTHRTRWIHAMREIFGE